MRIACILATGFEDSEFRVPYDQLREAGHEVSIIGMEEGEEVAGDKGRERVKVEQAVSSTSPERFDALLIPGGHSPDQLRAHPEMVEFVQGFQKKPIFAVCHGPQILITAEMVRGRTMTAWKTIQVDLRNAGAEVVDREVVVDGNLVTSRQPPDLQAFCREALQMLKQNGRAPHPQALPRS